MGREPGDRLVADGDAALGPVEVEVPAPARPLAVESDVAAETRVLGRHATSLVGRDDLVVVGARDQARREGPIRIGERGVVDRDEEAEAARAGRGGDAVVALRNALVAAPALRAGRLA